MFSQTAQSENFQSSLDQVVKLLNGFAQLDGLSLVLFLLTILGLGVSLTFFILLVIGKQTLAMAKDRWSGLTLRVITDALPCKVCYIDHSGTLIYSNRQDLERYYGQTMEQLLSKKMYQIFQKHFDSCLRGEVVNVEMQSLFNNSRIDQLRLVLHRGGSRNDVFGVICVTTDVTDCRMIEQELSAAKEAADSANAAKSIFLANMSHEIRTPLGAVLGFADLLARPNLMQGEKQQYIGAIKRNGILLKSLIDDILDISKVESGKMTLEIQTIKLADIFSDIISHLGVQSAAKNTQILLKPSADLPQEIKSDPTRLRQILINIIGNAVKFTENGQVEVVIERVADMSLLAFHVKDSGCGISEEHARDLFNPFYQGDSATKRQYGGTGLGLVLARRFARMLGGDVVLAESILEVGSTFTITIDAERSDSSPYPAEVVRAEFGFVPDPFVLRGISVLVVEDAPDNQLLISTYLEAAGANYEVADNGLEALSKIEHCGFDLVVMDIQMPIMDGYETAEELRLRGYDIPLIALTAHTMREEREKCLARGFEEHISKPINPQLLIATIRHLVTAHHKRLTLLGKEAQAAMNPLLSNIPTALYENNLP